MTKKIADVNYYYSCYKIIFNDYVEKEKEKLDLFLLEESERIKTKSELNNTICDRYKNKYIEDHENAKSEIIGRPKNKYSKANVKYKDNNIKLIDTLLDEKAENIEHVISEITIENKRQRILENEIIKLFQPDIDSFEE